MSVFPKIPKKFPARFLNQPKGENTHKSQNCSTVFFGVTQQNTCEGIGWHWLFVVTKSGTSVSSQCSGLFLVADSKGKTKAGGYTLRVPAVA